MFKSVHVSLLFGVMRLGCLLFAVLLYIYSIEAAKYELGEDIPVWADRVGPFNNPQEYYMYFNLPFCRPDDAKGKMEGIGESIAGYELRRSAIGISFGTTTRFGEICEKKLTFEEASIFAFAIENQYWYQLFIDDLPMWGLVGEIKEKEGAEKSHYLFTHLHFDLSKNENRVISANVTSENAVLIQEGAEINFSYSVSWTDTSIRHGNRFERYLDTSFFEHQIHWFSLFNSFMLLIFLMGLVGMILLRTLRKEYVTLGEEDPEEDIMDEAGWKLLHRDVFRAPRRLLLFSSVIGVGHQLIFTFLLVLGFGYLGAHYYASRGGIISAFVVWFVISAIISGYFSGSLYATYRGSSWIKNCFVTSSLFPLLLLCLAGALNFITIYNGALSYIPTGTIVLLGILWLIFSVPLSLVGTLFGRHLGKAADNKNQRINKVPRLIPTTPWYLSSWGIFLWSGLLPFSTVFVELFYVYTSVFHYKFYYVYGFASVIFVLFLLVTMAVNVVTTYFLLNNEDHQWQWSCTKQGTSTAFYIFVYAMYYYTYRTNMSGALQFVHFTIFSLGLSIAAGFISTAASFYASSNFVNRIYRGSKFE